MAFKEKLCFCHSGKPYENCCKAFHEGKTPSTALELMRSRYAAYALGKVEYILETTHSNHVDSKKDITERKEEIKIFCQFTQFVGLEILSFEEGEYISSVTFRASLLQKGKDVSFTEKSFFEKVQGRWLYVRGTIL
ncbi:MAG: YchJ family metal-binding protein [Chlamydiota bacterium]